MFYYLFHHLPVWRNLPNGKRNVRTFLLGTVAYILLHAFLFSQYSHLHPQIALIRNYIYYLWIADAIAMAVLYKNFYKKSILSEADNLLRGDEPVLDPNQPRLLPGENPVPVEMTAGLRGVTELPGGLIKIPNSEIPPGMMPIMGPRGLELVPKEMVNNVNPAQPQGPSIQELPQAPPTELLATPPQEQPIATSNQGSRSSVPRPLAPSVFRKIDAVSEIPPSSVPVTTQNPVVNEPKQQIVPEQRPVEVPTQPQLQPAPQQQAVTKTADKKIAPEPTPEPILEIVQEESEIEEFSNNEKGSNQSLTGSGTSINAAIEEDETIPVYSA